MDRPSPGLSTPMLPMELENPRQPPTLLSRLFAHTARRYILAGATAVFLLLLFLSRSSFGKPPPLLAPEEDNALWVRRAEAVKDAFRYAYAGYERLAFPHDELKPVSGKCDDEWFNGWGVTAVDGLDTMMIMGLNEEVDRVIAHIEKLKMDQSQPVHFFETVIRYLGGFLSAYELTHNPVLLDRADELGRRLLPAFGGPMGFPSFKVNVQTGQRLNGWAGDYALLSEMASCQLEFRALAHHTGRPAYVKAVDHITTFLNGLNVTDGLYPFMYKAVDGTPVDAMASVGARADSAYEYFLKQWLLSNRTETRFLDMYTRSANGVIDHLLYLSPTRQLLYVTDANHLNPSGTFEHLSCFFGGLLALGVAMIPDAPPTHLWAAEGLTHTCWLSYADQPSGLGFDEMAFPKPTKEDLWVRHVAEWRRRGSLGGKPPGVGQARPAALTEHWDYRARRASYILRPETIESFYILWRTTGDPKWRHRGWDIFQAIERNAKVANGYATITDVRKDPLVMGDAMPSWFFAETLKYLYLLFIDEDLLPLNTYVFNTEAHPLRIFEWTAREKQDFGIS